MRIVVDAMGTDARPVPDVAGAVLAAQEYDETIILVGDEYQIKQELDRYQTSNLKLEVVSADEQILMDDKPTLVMKGKSSSSMHIGMNMVKDGSADAFVTMGNTGAAHAIATLSTLRRIPGVKRPALSGVYPLKGRERIFLDVGANTDSKPEWLAQFAVMGSIYAEQAFGMPNPAVGLLANGEEDIKGDSLVQEAFRKIDQLHLNFIGNVEPIDILSGRVDVLVFDGFVGNIFVKSIEAAWRYMGDVIREEVSRSTLGQVGGLLLRPSLRNVRQRLNTSEVGGAPLLGVNGVVIIGHGGSDEYAVKNAIRQAMQAVSGNIIQSIQTGLQLLQI